MIEHLAQTFVDEFARILAFGGLGYLVGFLVGRRAQDDHRLRASILGETETPMKMPVRAGTLQRVTILMVMVALLASGVTSIAQARRNAEQDARQCEAVRELVDRITVRTDALGRADATGDDLWRGIRRVLVRQFDHGPQHPLVDKIDTYLIRRQNYKAQAQANPYTSSDLLEGCE